MKRTLIFILVIVCSTIACQTMAGINFSLPTKVQFPYSEDGKIFKSDFPLHIVFDTPPTQPVHLSYTSNAIRSEDNSDPMGVYYEQVIYNVSSRVLELAWDESMYGPLHGDCYHVEINIGFGDNDGNLLANQEPYSILYTIYPKEIEREEETCKIIYYDHSSATSPTQNNVPLKPFFDRLTSYNPEIVAIYENDNIPAEIRECILYAQSIWESALPPDMELKINYSMGPTEIPITTEVLYSKMGRDPFYIPYSLRFYKTGRDNVTVPDGEIVISSSIEWNTKVRDYSGNDKLHLTTALVRAIGRVLGIGSSLTLDENGNYSRSILRGYSIFDSMIINSSSQHFTAYSPFNSEGQAFIKSFLENEADGFYFKEILPRFRLEDTPFDEENPPLTKMKYGVMAGFLSPGAYFLDIDDSTIEVLRAIGWETAEYPQYAIEAEKEELKGIGSTRDEYHFALTNTHSDISDIKWTYSLPLLNGETEFIDLTNSTPRDYVAKLPILSEKDKYLRGVDGLIRGRIDCSFKENGVERRTVPYFFHRWSDPKIEFVRILGKKDTTSPNFYNLEYELSYFGGELVEVSYEIENSSAIRTFNIEDSYYHCGLIERLPRTRAVDITFTLKGEDGQSDIQQIHVPAETNKNTGFLELTQVGSLPLDIQLNCQYTVYDLTGRKVWEGSDITVFQESGVKGIYVISHQSPITQEKIINKIII